MKNQKQTEREIIKTTVPGTSELLCKGCNTPKIVMVEYDYTNPEHYDGISEYMCLNCGTRVGRWSGKILKKGESEKRYGYENNETRKRSKHQ